MNALLTDHRTVTTSGPDEIGATCTLLRDAAGTR
jgi:hypothetical protein